MPRAGLTPERVITEAACLADEIGSGRVTLSAVAERLGVRQPSLYKHVTNLDELRRGVAIQAKNQLAEVLGSAAVGKARADALTAMAHAYRGWAAAHSGLYEAAQRPPTKGDLDDEAASDRAMHVVTAVAAGYGIEGEQAIHAVRAYWAALHGFVNLESAHAFALAASVDESFDLLVRALVTVVEDWQRPPIHRERSERNTP